jgi:putative tryptophan/tyrosine transport system substrate-binding protein
MKRREFITLLGGAAVAWPLAAHAQQAERMRRVAILMGSAETALDQTNLTAFMSRLNELGWRTDRTLRTDVRWWTGTPEQMRSIIAEMFASSPDVFVAWTNLALATLQPMIGNFPVVFVGIGDPVGSGFVASLAHPGANITGFAVMTNRWAASGSKCSKKLRRSSPALWPSFTRRHPPIRVSGELSKQPRSVWPSR